MKYYLGIIALLWLTGTAWSEELKTREETMAAVSAAVAEIEAALPSHTHSDSPYQNSWIKPPDVLQRSVEKALQLTIDLRDRLANNPFLRVDGFSIGIPAGVSIEFRVPDSGKP